GLGAQLASICQLSRAGRSESGVIPAQPDRRHMPAGGKSEVNHRSCRKSLREPLRRDGFNALGRSKLQDPEDRVETVATHVSKRAVSEIVPAAPYERQICSVVRSNGRRT